MTDKELNKFIYHRLANSGNAYQAEVIALHYASMIKMAHDLLKLVEMRRDINAEQAIELDETIEYVSKTIREKHGKDFGIELEWNG